MVLFPCSDRCRFQKEGFCTREEPVLYFRQRRIVGQCPLQVKAEIASRTVFTPTNSMVSLHDSEIPRKL